MERIVMATFLLLFMFILGFGIRQELINEELKQQNTLQKLQIDELQKNQRLTAQDVGFLENLIIEGNYSEK